VIGLDTNVVIRFLAQDDKDQSAIATRLISRLSEEEQGFISSVVLAEVSWVLLRRYRLSRDEIFSTLLGLLETAELIVENSAAVYRALAVYKAGGSVEFADALIAETAALAGAKETVTFDRAAAAEAGMKLLR
jgi:predicted nucleic-acid-binding protein